MRHFVILAIVCFTITTTTVATQQCRSYGKQVGECVVISRCPPLLSIIINRSRTREDIIMLQKLTCISLTQNDPNEDPVVCCPLGEITSTPLEVNSHQNRGGSTQRPTRKTTTTTPRTTTYKNYFHTRRKPIFSESATTPETISNSVNSEEELFLRSQFLNHIPPLANCSAVDASGFKIIGGVNASHGEYPWMARLGYRNLKTNHVEYYCGGVIINKRYILTAGHCTYGYDENFELVHVRLGEHNTKVLQDCNIEELNSCSYPEDIPVEKVITHLQYNTITKHNDIALIRVAEDINFNSYFIKPVCLPFLKEYGIPELDPPLDKQTGIVAGWGRTNWTRSEGSVVLQYVTLPIVPTEKCIRDFRNRVNITPKQMCAGGEKNQDSCGGDSGGPLMVDSKISFKSIHKKKFQYGIVSFGPLKCGIGIPGVYTRVTEYLPWILRTLEP